MLASAMAQPSRCRASRIVATGKSRCSVPPEKKPHRGWYKVITLGANATDCQIDLPFALVLDRTTGKVSAAGRLTPW